MYGKDKKVFCINRTFILTLGEEDKYFLMLFSKTQGVAMEYLGDALWQLEWSGKESAIQGTMKNYAKQRMHETQTSENGKSMSSSNNL